MRIAIRNEIRNLSTRLAVGLGSLVCLMTLPAADANPKLSGDHVPTSRGDLVIHPIHHATLVLGWGRQILYVDPVGGAQVFQGLPRPSLILLTDIHGDHFNPGTLKAVAGPEARLVVPRAVAERLPTHLRKQSIVLANGESCSVEDIGIQAVPMYNLTPGRLKYHPKGRGNGYVLTLGGKRVYLSGDTEDIPEMRALKGIDVAFLCMNLPYTMDIRQAASAVKAFRPKIVYPYHYRGSDVAAFKKLVGTDSGIDVRLRDWY